MNPVEKRWVGTTSTIEYVMQFKTLVKVPVYYLVHKGTKNLIYEQEQTMQNSYLRSKF